MERRGATGETDTRVYRKGFRLMGEGKILERGRREIWGFGRERREGYWQGRSRGSEGEQARGQRWRNKKRGEVEPLYEVEDAEGRGAGGWEGVRLEGLKDLHLNSPLYPPAPLFPF